MKVRVGDNKISTHKKPLRNDLSYDTPVCLEILMSQFLLTSTIPRLFLIHLNHEIMVWALLSRVDPLKCEYFFNNLMICCLLMTLVGSIEISNKTSLIIRNSRSGLQRYLDFCCEESRRNSSPLSVSLYLHPLSLEISPRISDACQSIRTLTINEIYKGTTVIVSGLLGRNFTGIDLYEENVARAEKNISDAINSKISVKLQDQIEATQTEDVQSLEVFLNSN
jgi:hypothetical protein